MPPTRTCPRWDSGRVYDGVFHLLLSPEDLIPVVALSLLAGQRGPLLARRALRLLPLAWFAGGSLGLFAGAPRVPSFAWLSFLLMGGLVAADARISARSAPSSRSCLAAFTVL